MDYRNQPINLAYSLYYYYNVAEPEPCIYISTFQLIFVTISTVKYLRNKEQLGATIKLYLNKGDQKWLETQHTHTHTHTHTHKQKYTNTHTHILCNYILTANNNDRFRGMFQFVHENQL